MASSCKPADTPGSADVQKARSDANQENASAPKGTPSDPEKIWTNFDGRLALAEAKVLTGFGPRPSGSDANKQVRQHLVERLTSFGWQTSEQRLTEQAPDGREIEFCNLIARFRDPRHRRKDFSLALISILLQVRNFKIPAQATAVRIPLSCWNSPGPWL